MRDRRDALKTVAVSHSEHEFRNLLCRVIADNGDSKHLVFAGHG